MGQVKKKTKFDIDQTFQELFSCHLAGKSRDAAGIYQDLLENSTLQPEALHLFAMNAYRFGELKWAKKLGEKSLKLDTDNPQYYNTMGATLGALEEYEQAEKHYFKALKLKPAYLEARNNLADLYRMTDKLDEAVGQFTEVLKKDPLNVYALNQIAEPLLIMGKSNLALEHLDKCLKIDPYRTAALALKSIALAATENADQESELVDFDQLIHCYESYPPDDYINIEDFNHQLASYVEKHPRLRQDLHNISTRNGSQTAGNLLIDKNPLITGLESMIQKAVFEHIQSISPDLQHPHAMSIPSNFRITAWATLLTDQGHQQSHIHTDGWLSGVYYVQIPETICETNPDQEGWLEFGQGPEEYYAGHKPQTCQIRPQEGMFVTFPAFFWHRTIPFSGPKPRISIAFDLIPV